MPLVVLPEQLAGARQLIAGRDSVTVLAAMSPQQPDALIRATLLAAREAGIVLTVMFADLEGRFAFLDEQARRDVDRGLLRLIALAGAIPRSWSAWVDYLPYSLWDIDRMLADGALAVDIVLARLWSSDAPGEYDYGSMLGYTPSALATRASAAIELVPPAVAGLRTALRVRSDRADFVCAGTVAREAAASALSPSPEQREAGRLAASLIPDEATLQLGLGAIGEAIAPHLADKRDLGIHSGIMLPSLRRLMDLGAVNGRAKSIDANLAVATGIVGKMDATAADWGGLLELRPISATHDPDILRAQHRLWSVNSALEVDLIGQVNAEFADGVRIASGGGQTDFVRAAHIGDGASVIALTSRTRNGRSRIVSRLAPGCPPTAAPQDIDYVVTEFGIADLRGRSVRERSEALVAVAHPDDRQALAGVRASTKENRRVHAV